jgi:hypothetical protein
MILTTFTVLILAVLFNIRSKDKATGVIPLISLGVLLFETICGIPILFSQYWKVPIILSLINAILIAGLGSNRGNRVAAVLGLVAVLVVLNPFPMNSILSTGTDQAPSASLYAYGIQEAVIGSHPDIGGSGDLVFGKCVQYYKYFQYDTAIRDLRVDNGDVRTFSLCSRHWLNTISVLAGLLTMLELIGALLCVFVLLFQRQHPIDIPQHRDSAVVHPDSKSTL